MPRQSCNPTRAKLVMLTLRLALSTFLCVAIVSGDSYTEESYCANANNDRLLLSDKPYGVVIDPTWKSKPPYQKFVELAQVPLKESRYVNKPKLFEMVKIAYEAISEVPTERGINFAEGFAQYLKFIKPRGAMFCVDEAFTDAQAFFYFMVGDASSDEEKNTFANLAAADAETSRYLLRPMSRFNTDILSLEAILWLRNFERVDPPFDPMNEMPTQRMEQIAWRSFNQPFASLDQYKVFEYKYEQAHGTGTSFKPIPNFIDLDYDYGKALVETLQREADTLFSDAQGKCEHFLRADADDKLLEKAAVCSVQVEKKPELEDEIAFGKRIAREYYSYSRVLRLDLVEGDTRTDIQKFLAFVHDPSDKVTKRELSTFAIDKFLEFKLSRG